MINQRIIHSSYGDKSVFLPSPIQQGAELLNRTAELALHVQTKEELVSKIREEMEPLVQTAGKKLEMVDDIHEVITFQGFH